MEDEINICECVPKIARRAAHALTVVIDLPPDCVCALPACSCMVGTNTKIDKCKHLRGKLFHIKSAIKTSE